MMNFISPKWLKREIDGFNHTRIEILHQTDLNDLIATRSVFFRSGEITNAGELIYHVLNEFMTKQEEKLFDNLKQKLKSRISTEKLGQHLARLSYEYEEEFNSRLNRLTHEFLKNYLIEGRINWSRLAKL